MYVFLALCFVIGLLMGHMGYGINTWEWWIACGCVWASYFCGLEEEYNRRNK